MDLVVRDILVLLSIYPLITINLCEPTKSTVIGALPSNYPSVLVELQFSSNVWRTCRSGAVNLPR